MNKWVGALAVVVLTTAMLAIGSAPALGAQTRKLSGSFGSLNDPQGIAVAQASGDVYVADAGNHRIMKFDALGNQLLGFGSDVGGSGVDVCTTICEPGTAGSAPGQFSTAQFLAVDNSGGASSGDVYVGDTGDNTVSKFDSTGKLITTWGTGGQLNGSTTGAGSFGAIAGIAIAPSTGALLVFNTERQLFAFAQDGTFENEAQGGEADVSARGLGIDSEGDRLRVTGAGTIEKFSPEGTDLGTVTLETSEFTAVTSAFAVDSEGRDLYVATEAQTLDHYAFSGPEEIVQRDGSTCQVFFSGPGCSPTDSVPISFVGTGVGLNSESGTTYVSNPTVGKVFVYTPETIPDVINGPASEKGPTSATLNGSVNPDGLPLTGCHFEYGTTEAYGQSVECVPAAGAIPADSSPHAVSAHVTGLEAGVTYHFRLVAEDENGSNASGDETFSTPPRPSIDGAAAIELAPEAATLTTRIDPHGFDTHYHFEYGTSTEYGTEVPVPPEDIGAGEGDVSRSQRITNLEEGTYHWRVVAVNENGTSVSPDHTFIYERAGAALPDGRAYEMVTPVKKNGALIGSLSLPEVARDGNRVMSQSIQCFAGAEACNGQRRSGVGSPYEFTRTGAGWVTTAMSPSATALPFSNLMGYEVNTGMAFFSAPPERSAADQLYTREPEGSFVRVGPVTPPQEGAKGPLGGFAGGVEQTYSRDLSHLAWEAVPSGFWPSLDETKGSASVYEYAAPGQSQPLLVGVSGGPGSRDLVSRCATALGGISSANPPGMMSADGRVVYVTAVGGEECVGTGANAATPVKANELLARVDGEGPEAHTVVVSARSPKCSGTCSTSPAGDAQFIGASADGTKAIFASTQQLTNQATEDGQGGDTAVSCHQTTGANGCNLYMYDFADPTAERLIDISAGDTSGGGPRVQGVLAISEDGSHVYFVAKGVLTPQGNARGEHAQSGADNLYVFERNASAPSGRVGFVAGLPSSDEQEWVVVAGDPANVTPDGRYLVFVSHGTLTADDTSRSGALQVFRYDAATHQIVRISIGNDGFNDNGNRSEPTPCGVSVCSEDVSLAFGWNSRRDPTMSDDGAYVFFESPVGLTPRALDDVPLAATSPPAYAENVYEWHEGHIYLISDGKDLGQNAGGSPHCGSGVGSIEEAASAMCLLGSDATGNNVFFTTTDQLVKQDTDTELDYYDARICTEAEPCLQSPAPQASCREAECQGPTLPPPPPPVAATLSFVGPGNATPPQGKAKLLSHSVHGGKFTIVVRLPGAGKLSIKGTGVGAVSHSVTRAGTYRFVVSLTRRQRIVLRLHHRHKVRLKLSVSFAPSVGAPSTVGIVMTARI
jgi:hypothetical protein